MLMFDVLHTLHESVPTYTYRHLCVFFVCESVFARVPVCVSVRACAADTFATSCMHRAMLCCTHILEIWHWAKQVGVRMHAMFV